MYWRLSRSRSQGHKVHNVLKAIEVKVTGSQSAHNVLKAIEWPAWVLHPDSSSSSVSVKNMFDWSCSAATWWIFSGAVQYVQYNSSNSSSNNNNWPWSFAAKADQPWIKQKIYMRREVEMLYGTTFTQIILNTNTCPVWNCSDIQMNIGTILALFTIAFNIKSQSLSHEFRVQSTVKLHYWTHSIFETLTFVDWF